MTNQFQLGWKKDPEDVRDVVSARALAAPKKLPYKFQLPVDLPIYDQGPIGSCTANSGCSCYMYECMEKYLEFNPSRLFLYYNTRLIEGTTEEDSGAYIRDTFKSMNKHGVCSEKMWQYDVNRFTQKPNDAAYTDALTHKAIQYARVPQDKFAIQRTLLTGAAISFGFYVYESFMKGNWHRISGKMPIPKSTEKLLGGHAVTIVGYDNRKRSFLIQNSWGEGWGIKGKFWMPYAYLLDPSRADDFWCIESCTL